MKQQTWPLKRPRRAGQTVPEGRSPNDPSGRDGRMIEVVLKSSTKPMFWLLGRAPMVLSALLAMAVLVVWVRSYTLAERYGWFELYEDGPAVQQRSGNVVVSLGGLRLLIYDVTSADPERIGRMRYEYAGSANTPRVGYRTNPNPRYPMRGNPNDGIVTSLGFQFHHAENRDPQTIERRWGFTIPFWAIFLLTASYPFGKYIAGVVRRQREDRAALGLCPRCGMALGQHSTRCPTCDKPIVSVAR